MRNEWKRRWGWRVSAVVLTGGLLVLGTGTVVTQAGDRDDDHNKRNPFQRILDKLDDILDAVFVPGGVFTGVFKGFYWTATTVADFPHLVWYVDLENGSTLSANKLSSLLAWCVRGGMNADAY